MKRTARKHITSTKGKVLHGTIVSDKMDDTVVVAVNRYVKLPKLGKYVRKTKRYSAHLPRDMRIQVGDTVSIRSCRPISKTKSFIVQKKKDTASAQEITA